MGHNTGGFGALHSLSSPTKLPDAFSALTLSVTLIPPRFHLGRKSGLLYALGDSVSPPPRPPEVVSGQNFHRAPENEGAKGDTSSMNLPGTPGPIRP